MASKNKKSGWGPPKTIKEIKLDYNHLLGRRYIFFSTLKTTHPNLATNVEAHFNNIADALQGKSTKGQNENSSEQINYLNEYLEFLQTLITNEQEAEQSYLSNLVNKLNSKNSFSKREQEIYQDIISKMTGDNIDYLGVIKILNRIKLDQEKYNDALNNQITNIKKFNDAIKKTEEETSKEDIEFQQQLNELYVFNQGKYKQKLSKKIKLEEFLPSIYQPIQDLLIKNLNFLKNNPVVVNIIATNISKKDSPSAEEVERELKRLILQQSIRNVDIENIYKENGKSGITELVDNLITTEIENVITPPKISTVEELYFNQSGQGIGKVLSTLDNKDDIETFFEHYAQYGNPDLKEKGMDLIDQIQKASTLSSKGALRGQLTKLVKTTLNTVWNDFYNYWDYSPEKLLSFLPTDALSRDVYFTFDQALTFSIKNYTTAEIATIPGIIETALTNKLTEIQKAFIPGGKILLKNDIMITWEFNNNALQELTKKYSSDKYKKELIDILTEQAENGYKNFLQKYQAATDNTTNIKEAKKLYLAEMQTLADDFINLFNELKKDEEEQQKLQDYITNLFFEGITVKEYDYYNPDVGYVAGSLGGGGRVVDAIPNILAMYEAGGITPFDTELIIESLLNCGKGMIVGDTYSNLIDNLKDYLIGGAAMMLFDDGFANAKEFLEQVQKMFTETNTKGPRQVHLMLLNGIYYPFSFLLEQIYLNLQSVFNDIKEKAEKPETIMTTNQLYIQNNITNFSNEEWAEKGYNNSQARWNYISSQAQENVKIKFTFMGGLLDILENLANALK